MKNETLNTHCTATDGKPPVSGSACYLCSGTGIEDRDYYDEDNNMEIVTIKEKCSCCNGTGVDED